MASRAIADHSPVLSFRVGSASFGAHSSEVAEVLRRPKLTRIPLAPAGVLGLTSVRGSVVPIVSIAGPLGCVDEDVSPRSRILLLHLDEPVGVAVDDVGTLSRGGEPVRDQGRATLQQRRLVELAALVRQEFAALVRRGARTVGAQAKASVPTVSHDHVSLLAFDLAGQTYALPLGDVCEVFALDTQVAELPRTDDAVLGVVTLRERVLPLVRLAALLGIRGSADSGKAVRIVVAHIGEARIGLAVDRIHAVLRIPQDTIDAVPSILNRGAGEAQIQSIHRSPDGRGIVSILSAERLFREDTVARLVAETRERDTGMGGPTQEKSTEQALVFQLGEEEFGLPIGAVREVVRLPEKITRIPRAPGFVKGVINHRGRMLPVIDQRRRFGLPGDRSTDRRRVIVTEIDGMQVGFLVDRVLEVLQLANGQVQPTPALGVEGSRLFDRVVTLNVGNRMLLLIDPRELLDRAERDLLASLEQREEDADAS